MVSVMRRHALLVPSLLVLALPAPAGAQIKAPVDTAKAGGTQMRLGAGRFSVTPGRVVAGRPVTVSFRAKGPAKAVRAQVSIGRARLVLTDVPTRTTFSRRWIPQVGAGRYQARLVVRAGGLRRARTFPVTVTPAPTPAPAPATTNGIFPVRGPYSFGGDGARFGASRGDHVHQGQDITAAWGTPIVSPVKGYVYWRKVQPDGAGHYLIIRDAGGADYVFMHLVSGSELVAKGDPVRAGQQIAQVGSTGDSSGPHLHFEIWPDGWYAPGSQPIDPLPQLQAWAAD
jgi:murein DD-endopeptidase MepM/ murein hydrolase activator NlpD